MTNKPIFIVLQVLFTLIMYAAGVLLVGLTLFPSLYMIIDYWDHTAELDLTVRVLGLSLRIVFGYVIFGLLLIFTTSLTRILLMLNVKEGSYAIGSLGMLRWMLSSALIVLVRVFFMDFMLLTPFSSLFYRLMGAKIGINTQINSTRVGDISLLEIGNNAVIGGNATVICHLFEKKGLVIKKVKIGRNVIIGLNSVIMPGVEIGDHSTIAAGAIVPKDTVIPAGSVYYGVTKTGT
ncbi:MAG: hypothetical protein ACI9F2_001001 [Lysobacterales bacterium]|jgi:hypothetical protein